LKQLVIPLAAASICSLASPASCRFTTATKNSTAIANLIWTPLLIERPAINLRKRNGLPTDNYNHRMRNLLIVVAMFFASIQPWRTLFVSTRATCSADRRQGNLARCPVELKIKNQARPSPEN